MADERVTMILEMVDKATPVLTQFTKSVEALNAKLSNLGAGSSGIGGLSSSLQQVIGLMSQLGNHTQQANGHATDLANTFANVASISGITAQSTGLGQLSQQFTQAQTAAAHFYEAERLGNEALRVGTISPATTATVSQESDLLRRQQIHYDQATQLQDAAEANHRNASNRTIHNNQRTGDSFVNLGTKIAIWGMAIGSVAAILKSIADAVVDVAIKSDKLTQSLTAIAGTNKFVAGDMQFLKDTTEKLGLEFWSTSDAFSQFSAAAQGTQMQGEKTRVVFEKVTGAMSQMGKSPAEISGALNAMGQMLSKGVVQMEELRGQLGDRLPGAMAKAAAAMGVTTSELINMVTKGEVVASDFLPKFADALGNTTGRIETAQASVNRLSNEWEFFKQTITSSNTISFIVDGIADSFKRLRLAFGGEGDTLAEKATIALEKAKNDLQHAQGALSTATFYGWDSQVRERTSQVEGLQKIVDALGKNVEATKPKPNQNAPVDNTPVLSTKERNKADSLLEAARTSREKLEEETKLVQKAIAAHTLTKEQGLKIIADLNKKFEESEGKKDKKAGAAEAKLATAADNAADALRRELMGLSALTQAEQTNFEIQTGKYDKLNPKQQELLMSLARQVDVMHQLTATTQAYFGLTSAAETNLNTITRTTQQTKDYLGVLESKGKVEADIFASQQKAMEDINSKVRDAKLALEQIVALDEKLGRGVSATQIAAQATLTGYQNAAKDLSSSDYLDKVKQASTEQQKVNHEQDTWNKYIGAGRDELKSLSTSLSELQAMAAKGIITPEELAKGSAAINKQADEIKNGVSVMSEFMKAAAHGMQNSMSTFFFDAMQGKMTDLVGGFKKMIDKIVADMLAAQLAKTLFGSFGDYGSKGNTDSGTGLIGGLGTMLSGMFRASGGPVTGNQPYIVGEVGPELFVPSVSGSIVPNDKVSGMTGGGGVVMNNYITAMDSQDTMRALNKVKRQAASMYNNVNSTYNMR